MKVKVLYAHAQKHAHAYQSHRSNQSDWSNQSKSIEVIVKAMEVNPSFKEMLIFDRLCLVTISFDQLRSTSIDYNWLRLITIGIAIY